MTQVYCSGCYNRHDAEDCPYKGYLNRKRTIGKSIGGWTAMTKPWWWTPENQILADRVQEAFDERDRKAIEWALSDPSDKVAP